MRNKYIKFLDYNITPENFGLLRELLQKELLTESITQIEADMEKLYSKIDKLQSLKDLLYEDKNKSLDQIIELNNG